MQSSAPIKPTENLVKAVVTAATHLSDPLSAMDEIMKLPKDNHGNILIGLLDDQNFNHWNSYLKNLVPFKVFGPIIVPTNIQVVKALLMEQKNDPEKFAGNASSDKIAELTGTDNIFAAKDPKIHAEHKAAFKEHLHDFRLNISIAAPIVLQFLKDIIKQEKTINDAMLESLCARIMCGFLLKPGDANNDDLVNAVITLKKHFIDLATLKKLDSEDAHYFSANELIKERIASLYDSEQSYPNFLRKKSYELEQIHSHIISLMMVGFDNLRSAVTSSLVNFSSHPSQHAELKKELLNVDGTPYLHIDPVKLNIPTATAWQQAFIMDNIPVLPQNQGAPELAAKISNNAGKRFFQESTRLVPPVWLQARKNGDQGFEISYKDADGKPVQLNIPPRATILIPMFYLARELNHGDMFDQAREPSPLPLPFSTGPNACPGRNIAYATIGCLLGFMLQSGVACQLFDKLIFSPKVSLTLEHAALKLNRTTSLSNKDYDALPPRITTFPGNFWNSIPDHAMPAAMAGASILAAAYFQTESLITSVLAGGATAALVWKLLEWLDDQAPAEQIARPR